MKIGYDLNGWRKLHPFFHSEQPYAVFPLIMVPLPHKGQGCPSDTLGEVALAFFVVLALRTAGFGFSAGATAGVCTLIRR